MSTLFEFVYDSIDRTPLLGEALNDYLTEEHGPDAFVGGYVAFGDDHRVLDVRPYIVIGNGDLSLPHGDGRAAWDDFVAWMDSIGSHHAITFARRRLVDGDNIEPLPADVNIYDNVTNRSPEAGIVYLGHLITNGESHGLLIDKHNADPMAMLLNGLSNDTKARIGRDLLANLKASDTDIDPIVIEAVEDTLALLEAGGDPHDAPEDLKDRVREALRVIEARLAEADERPPRPASPMDLPPISKRPDVPPAFYN